VTAKSQLLETLIISQSLPVRRDLRHFHFLMRLAFKNIQAQTGKPK
jgi:hypothetical protein